MSPPADDRQRLAARRCDRYRLRDVAAGLLSGEAVYRCGRFAASHPGQATGCPPGFIAVKKGAHGAHFGNVTTCKSVWHCPVCAAKIAGGRREEIHEAMVQHVATRGLVYMATFTTPHREWHECRPLRQAVSAAFRKIAAGKHWKPMKEAAGLLGSIRALEVTQGGNGWHPHLHVLFFFDHDDAQRAENFGKLVFTRWARVIARMQMGRCSQDAWKFERCASPGDAGDYVTKWGPDWELTHAHLKDAKGGGRTPWRILIDYADDGLARDADLFREYGLAFKGAKQLTWSRGLKAHFGLDDVDDDELADAEPPAETVALVHEHAMATLLQQRRATALLDAAEAGGGEAVIAFLYKLGVPQEYYRSVSRGDFRPPPANTMGSQRGQ